MGPLDRGGGGVQMEKISLAGHFFSSGAKCAYLPCIAHLSRAIFFRPRAIHGPRAPIWEALKYGAVTSDKTPEPYLWYKYRNS